LGYVNKFEGRPDLETSGWLKRAILSEVIHFENWNNTEVTSWNDTNMVIQNLDDDSEK
jgi:hypothetical protein